MRQYDIMNAISFETNWWMDLACSRSIPYILSITTKTLVSLEPATSLSANIIPYILEMTIMMLISFEPITPLNVNIITCISGITAKMLVSLEPTAPLSASSQISAYGKHWQHETDAVTQPYSHNTWFIPSFSFPYSIVFLIYLFRFQVTSSYRWYHTWLLSRYHIIKVKLNNQNNMEPRQT